MFLCKGTRFLYISWKGNHKLLAFKCIDQILPLALTFLAEYVSANPEFQICVNTFPPICKCRCRFCLFALKFSPIFSVLINTMAICTYISWKRVITKSNMLKCAYLALPRPKCKSPNLKSELKFPSSHKFKSSNLSSELIFPSSRECKHSIQ